MSESTGDGSGVILRISSRVAICLSEWPAFSDVKFRILGPSA